MASPVPTRCSCLPSLHVGPRGRPTARWRDKNGAGLISRSCPGGRDTRIQRERPSPTSDCHRDFYWAEGTWRSSPTPVRRHWMRFVLVRRQSLYVSVVPNWPAGAREIWQSERLSSLCSVHLVPVAPTGSQLKVYPSRPRYCLLCDALVEVILLTWTLSFRLIRLESIIDWFCLFSRTGET